MMLVSISNTEEIVGKEESEFQKEPEHFFDFLMSSDHRERSENLSEEQIAILKEKFQRKKKRRLGRKAEKTSISI